MIRSASDPRWPAAALADRGALLIDHAHCERKAASTALALLSRYCERPELVRALSALAIEELQHFRAVAARLRARGLPLGRDRGNPYAQALHAQVRGPEPEQQLDRLLVAGLIEARSHERLALLAVELAAEPEGRFYARLARAEAGHSRLFAELARGVPGAATPTAAAERAERRLAELAELEAALVASLPLGPRIH